ncbi:MAG: CRISPR-associated endonuclease Cas2 [Bacilli bacterium]|jgi:CRISPR-associated protein Cas2
MYVIISYDVEAKRCVKVMKILRRYLYHLQESVFEGNLTYKQLRDLKIELDNVTDKDYDSIVIYEMLSDKYLVKNYIGKERKQEIVI